MMAHRCGEPLIAREQFCIQRLSEGDVGGVIGAKIIPQGPNARQQPTMWVSSDSHVCEIHQGRVASIRRYITIGNKSTDNLRNLQVEEMRCVHRLTDAEQPWFDHRHCRGAQ